MRLPLVAVALWFGFCLTSQAAQPNRWEKSIAEFERADGERPPQPDGVLFVGASGIRRWTTLAEDFPGLPVMNRGFGGALFSDMLHFADRAITIYRPKVIVLQGGANDLGAKKTPQLVLADFRALISAIRHRLPDTKIVFLGINPSPSRWAQRDVQQATNTLLRDHLMSLKNTVFVDMWDDMLGADGLPRKELYVADELHPSDVEYKRRAKLILPHLR